MKKSVLLTRSKVANSALKEKFGNKDLDLIECNLIEYELFSVEAEYINQFSDLIITSNFAAHNIPDAPRDNMPVWVVGEKSANILKNKGYKVKCYASNVENLKRRIPDYLYNKMLYLSGDHITVSMPLGTTRKILYKTIYLKLLSENEMTRYKEGIDYIVLYSENCAKTLLKLLIENNLVNYLGNTTYIAISSKVARVFEQVFKNVVVCHDTDSMLKYIEKHD
ncbi:MAG: uroporphyrinogen-III synthase [Rickettsiaceae bacterium]|nr:uroporphyrinogen-III synthase [Rickettsiaceae bacterium]